jgi:hypothetical protein
MALASIAVPADPKRDARARELVDSVPTWPLYTLKVAHGSFEPGTVFRRAHGSNGARYLVNAVACECKDYQQAGNICKHIRAIVLWEQEQATFDAELDRVLGPAPKARPSYADLFPACKSGCGDVSETRDGYCDRCAIDREWEARRDHAAA